MYVYLYVCVCMYMYIYIYIYIFDKNFNNRYFITLEITLIRTVDIGDGGYCLSGMSGVRGGGNSGV